MSQVKSTCPYCGVGCGVNIEKKADKTLVLGDENHPANFGKLCSKGSALGDTLSKNEEVRRLSSPCIDGEPVDWDQATREVAEKINQSIQEHGRDSVAFYLSGQLLTEDYYVANKLMKGYIGTANVDTNSRLCMASAVASYKRAFGADAVPCSYEDLDVTDLIILIGSNAAWTHPILYQRMVAAKAANPKLKIVLIDPRETASCDIADLHLKIKPSADGFLFNGLLNYLYNETNVIDADFIEQSTQGFDEALSAVESATIEQTARETGLDSKELNHFFELYANTDKVISFYSMGINQSATGTDKCNAIINCHLATGRIGKPGAGPFSITGQPNAMGGREVGGLANQLAAHMDFDAEDCDRVQRFWGSPTIATKPGLKAVELFDAVERGDIKVLWIMATNPAVSLPDSDRVRRALELCPTVIVSDVTNTDTSDLADIVLPAQAWAEKNGTVTNSERRISRQRQFIKPFKDAKADWQILCQVAQKMGISDGFNFVGPEDIFNEHAALSAFENNGRRCFDISGLQNLSPKEYNDLTPIQWPVRSLNSGGENKGTERLFTDGLFYTKNQKANFIPTFAKLAESVGNVNYFVLNTGRLRDQWHTMTRTGNVSKLSAHDDTPFVLVHPDDAQELGLEEHDMARLTKDSGQPDTSQYIGQIRLSLQVKRRELFCPIHWNQQFADKGVVTSLIDSIVDPVSGQPQLKASSVLIQKIDNLQWARVASLEPLDVKEFDYWAQTKTARGYITLIGFLTTMDFSSWAQRYVSNDVRLISFAAPQNQAQTILAANENDIELLLYSQADVKKLPSFQWLSSAFDQNQTSQLRRLIRDESDGQDAAICSCFGTSKKVITQSIESGVNDVFELGSKLGCGSKCGSCRPELSALIKAYRESQPAIA